MPAAPRCLLDFPDPDDGRPVRLAFGDAAAFHVARTLDQVVPVLDAADRAARAGAWVVGFVAYEAAPAFDRALAAANADARLPLAWFAVFPSPPVATPHVANGGPAGIDPATAVTPAAYAAGVARIREYIAAGDVYQVNYTIPFAAHAGDPLALYEHLRGAQHGRWSAYLDLGDAQVMSASPELFFDRRGPVVTMRPMKGTAPRGLSSADDDRVRDALVASEKDRAENVMIVDLVRNDLGRIARTGSVRVTALCEPERYPRVWQLTSSVEAWVDPALPLSGVFRALFPCGSITGAPKVRATEIIRELEGAPRALYCGAVGVIRPGGDATFNVAIRTAWTADGGATVHLNAGGAVTIDSTAAGELAEVRAKVAAFTGADEVPALFETLRVEHGAPLRVERHLARLRASAAYFGIPFDDARARAALADACIGARHLPLGRGRVVLAPDGGVRAEVMPFDHGSDAGPRRVALADAPVSRGDRRLYHKVTDRRLYEAALAAHPDAFDVVLWNQAGEATELTRGTLVARLDGILCTPPLACGLLPGILRGELLESGEVVERVLPLADLPRATELWFVNALRGWVSLRLS